MSSHRDMPCEGHTKSNVEAAEHSARRPDIRHPSEIRHVSLDHAPHWTADYGVGDRLCRHQLNSFTRSSPASQTPMIPATKMDPNTSMYGVASLAKSTEDPTTRSVLKNCPRRIDLTVELIEATPGSGGGCPLSGVDRLKAASGTRQAEYQ